MLDGFRQRLSERRSKYSLRKHIGRLRREGRLPQIGLAAVAVLTIGGLAFARCQDSITGPNAPVAETPVGGAVTAGGSVTTPSASLGSETFRENTVERNVVFSGVNPCNGDAVKAFGKRHDKIKIVASATSFAVDHHINDSFRGEAIDDADQIYTGSDVHKDNFEIGIDGVEHRELTNEHLIANGPAPNWILHFHQRSDFRFDDPLNPTVTFKGHASCPSDSRCTVPGGCVDRDLTVLSATP
jgi:hypothetical protein